MASSQKAIHFYFALFSEIKRQYLEDRKEQDKEN